MVFKRVVMSPKPAFHNLLALMLAGAVSVFLVTGASSVSAQDQAQPQTPPQDNSQKDNSQNSGKPKQEVPADAGGPTGNVGPYSIPKKNPEAPPPPPPPAAAKKVEDMPDYSIKVNVPLVNVDVLVTTKSGQFVPGLKKDNFRVFEDGSQQQITNFNVAEAPITAVLLLEFASTNYPILYDTLSASYSFANTMKKED